MHALPNEFWWAFGFGSIVLLLLSFAIIVILVYSQRRSIRQQRERLEELSRSEEKYRGLFENSLVGLVRISLDYAAVLEANEAALRLFSCSSAEQLTRELPRILGETFQELLLQLRRDGRVENRECRFTRIGKPDGWCIVAGRVDPQHQIAECVILDVIEKKSIESQLLRAQRLESIGVMAGGIAHDLSNVLAPIVGSVEFLLQKNEQSGHYRFLEIIRSSVKRATDLISQLLVFARGVEGKRESIQPVAVGSEVVNFIRKTFPKEIKIQFRGGNMLWNVTADATQLNQVLINLCVNARDAMPLGGSLTVTMENLVLDRELVGVNASASPGPYVRISVADTGTGIPPEVLDKIFEPFYTTKAIGKGTGLGLSTTLGIVKSHHAVITVESVMSQGSTFALYFPVADQTLPAAYEADRVQQRRGNRKWLLLIDDDEAMQGSFKASLENGGYHVHVAEDGNKALAILAKDENQICGVITDLSMPNRGGLDTIGELRRRKPNVPIIVITGFSFPDAIPEPGEQRPDAILRKPFSTEQLLRLVKEHVH